MMARSQGTALLRRQVS